MKKKIQKIIALIVAISAFAIPATAYASNSYNVLETTRENATRTLQWDYIMMCGGSFYQDEGFRKVKFDTSLVLYEGHAGIVVQLQELSTDGTYWEDMDGERWGQYVRGPECDFTVGEISVPAGSYRCKVIFTAYTEDGIPLEDYIAFSDAVTIY